MYAIIGTTAVALALANRLGAGAPTALLASEVVPGPFLWRRAHPETGEGVRSALHGVETLYIVPSGADGETLHGIALAMKRQAFRRAVVVLRHGAPVPAGIADRTEWAHVRIGTCWGVEEPLVAAWLQHATEGRRLAVAEAGPVRVSSMRDAVAAIRAAADFPGARWVLAGEEVTFDDLAEAVSERVGTKKKVRRVSLARMAKRAGIELARIERWFEGGPTETNTGKWRSHAPLGRVGWTR